MPFVVAYYLRLPTNRVTVTKVSADFPSAIWKSRQRLFSPSPFRSISLGAPLDYRSLPPTASILVEHRVFHHRHHLLGLLNPRHLDRQRRASALGFIFKPCNVFTGRPCLVTHVYHLGARVATSFTKSSTKHSIVIAIFKSHTSKLIKH